jgi:hypothetical protein
MLRILLILLCSIFLTSCAERPYKKADLSMYGGRVGYLEKEIEPNTFVLEYSHIGGYDYDLEKSKEYWKFRASELCPNGYDGALEVIDPADAKIEEFVCPQRFCSKYPLVSGVVKCKN